MQRELCVAFSKCPAIAQQSPTSYAPIVAEPMNPIVVTAGHYPMVEVGLIVNDKTFVEIVETPLLHVAEGAAIRVYFQLQTDTRFCFLTPRSLILPLPCSVRPASDVSEAHRQMLQGTAKLRR